VTHGLNIYKLAGIYDNYPQLDVHSTKAAVKWKILSQFQYTYVGRSQLRMLVQDVCLCVC